MHDDAVHLSPRESVLKRKKKAYGGHLSGGARRVGSAVTAHRPDETGTRSGSMAATSTAAPAAAPHPTPPPAEFSSDEVDFLQKAFAEVASAVDGKAHFADIASQLPCCPLAARFLEREAARNDGRLTVDQCLRALNAFGTHASAQQRANALFSAYDLDEDGVLDEGDLFVFVKMFVAVSDDGLERLARHMLGGKPHITRAEFQSKLSGGDVLEMHLIPV